LTTLLGHEYGGIGFVPIGESPWTQPCRTEMVYGETTSGTVSSTPIPCQSVTMVLPDVEGMVTPTAVGELSGLGVNVVIQNVHSSSIPPGHIVSTSPSGGSTVHARQPVIVSISVPGS
jgi:beta-lactam-binding protein with PASTA domain